MTFTNILYEVLDEVAVLTFNRPEVSNGFNIPMCQEILEAISLAASDITSQLLYQLSYFGNGGRYRTRTYDPLLVRQVL